MGIICIFQNGDYVYLIDQPIKLTKRTSLWKLLIQQSFKKLYQIVTKTNQTCLGLRLNDRGFFNPCRLLFEAGLHGLCPIYNGSMLFLCEETVSDFRSTIQIL